MNRIDRFKNGFVLLGNSFAVMRANPRLLLFPFATAVLTLVVGGMIVVASLFVAGGLSGWAGWAAQSFAPFVIGMAAWVVAACAFTYALGVAGQIYLCVLYRFATAGTLPAGYTSEMLGQAWTPKRA